MTPTVNLPILAERFTQLSRSAYFDPAFGEFCERTLQAIHHVEGRLDRYDEVVVRGFVIHVWKVIRFLMGSRSNDAPHETQYVLRKALRHWVDREALVSSASLEELNYFFEPLDLWDQISKTLSDFDTEGYAPLLVRIGSPAAYRNRPIFCVPLFHELGHFVDDYYKISARTLFVNPPDPPPSGSNIDAKVWRSINLNHRMEHFADLFSACYVGEAAKKSLLAIAPDDQDSPTHPSTAKRCDVMASFLESRSHRIVDLFQNILDASGITRLSHFFRLPDISEPFDEILTAPLAGDEELFGVFPSAWDYLERQIEDRTAPWVGGKTAPFKIEKTINDLVEKSIRNYEIREKWCDGSIDEAAAR